MLMFTSNEYKIIKINPSCCTFCTFTLLLLNMTYLVLANSVDPDQLASEAN